MLRAQTARQDALRRCKYLSSQLGSTSALIERLLPCGLSESWIRKFVGGFSTNVTIGKLDQLLNALEAIEAGESK
jgi:hypothetical protein